MINMMIISGSPASVSTTRGLAQQVRKLAIPCEILFFDVGEDKLPLFTGDKEEYEYESVKKFMDYAKKADCFFICTPEYHNGMSGALKNAIDFLSSAVFEDKPVAIAAASGGGKGGINALNNLRLVLRSLYALVIADQLAVNPSDFNKNLELVNEDSIAQIKLMLKKLTTLTSFLLKNESLLHGNLIV